MCCQLLRHENGSAGVVTEAVRVLSSHRVRWLCCLAAVCLMATSCAKKASAPSQAETGIASWYGHPFDGRPTASGEIYDMEKMTAAHRTLPFGTVVRVESLATHKTSEVRINDRGPFVQGRIIDLSHAAAEAIDMQSIANVRLQVVSTPPTRGADLFAVQIGGFSERAPAEQLRDQMQREYGAATLVFRPGDQTWRVLVGLEPTLAGANALAQQLNRESGPAFVVRVDEAP
ncbi:MAG TPA: septal ring lytic transglycosylase RlpA family protein [Terriglobia bacterium]|nr:septal ring lytic transglycosylase RlpA family protein [Terriglobia bacterium]